MSGKDRSAFFSLVPRALHIHNRGQSPRTTYLNKLQCRQVLHIVKTTDYQTYAVPIGTDKSSVMSPRTLSAVTNIQHLSVLLLLFMDNIMTSKSTCYRTSPDIPKSSLLLKYIHSLPDTNIFKSTSLFKGYRFMFIALYMNRRKTRNLANTA